MRRVLLYLPLLGALAIAGFIATIDRPIAVVFGGGAFMIWLIVVRTRAQRGAAVNNTGLTLMGEGRIVEALAKFEEAKGLLSSPLPTFNIGMASLWLWRLDEARLALEAATTTLAGAPMRVIAMPALHLIATLQSDAPRVAKYAQELVTLKNERSSIVHMARAVVALREKRWKDVLDALSLQNTRPLGGPARATADAMRAWAMVEVGAPCPPIDHVGVFGETGPAAVRKWWPEFAEFLERTAAR
jgi:hypothetical protein